MNTKELITMMPMFEGLNETVVEQLASLADDRIFEAGSLIVGESDRPRSLYLVGEGRVKIYKSSSQGKEQTLYVFGEGEPFCLCSAFEENEFPANAAALTKARIISFPTSELERIARKEPALLTDIILVLSRRLREAMRMVESLSLKDISQRVAMFLLQNAGRGAAPGETITLHITQRELAKLLGTTPESLTRTIKKMDADQLIQQEGKRIKILAPEQLEQLADMI